MCQDEMKKVDLDTRFALEPNGILAAAKSFVPQDYAYAGIKSASAIDEVQSELNHLRKAVENTISKKQYESMMSNLNAKIERLELEQAGYRKAVGDIIAGLRNDR